MQDNKLTGKEIFDQLHQDMVDPHHPIFDQLRAYLLWEKHLLELIKIPRHQLRPHYSYVLVSDIPEYFKTEFEQFFLGQNLLQHVDHPEESLLDTKRLDSFIAYLKENPSYLQKGNGQA
ncbi:hypothetical protein [Acinetobacter pittii]|uniref:hypothetical protein n=1 Tax=Acinetobacter pittii TaxID=48296 RepID=UPI001F1D2F74|nr:hypothetical protein [Acinetobacter pittii]MDA2253317.1 hypothetical protein [Bacillus cereus]MCE6238514.1 hypothetical protein [Acinetobacter pittii]MCE6693266.1 hypothetical protein [Acinetobacter pittii]MCE6700720.1 hypothetical protein [Acinetobacter pittii]WLE90678.1 hypothetical protein PNCAADPE_00003 [Acinetobacter pittii]